MNAKPVSVKLETSLKERLDVLAAAKDRSAHWLMKQAIQEYVEREEKRETFRRDAVAAWEQYRATGAHATFDAVDDWLAALEEGRDAEPPACRR